MERKSLYVPVLRSHRAERKAVSELQADARSIMAPLIEISKATARKLDPLPANKVAKELQELTGSCGRGESYLDLRALMDRPDFDMIGRDLQRRLLDLRSEVQLVLRMSDLIQPQRVSSISELIRRNGAGFRVTRADCLGVELSGTPAYLRRLGLAISDMDLLVDCQVVEEGQDLSGTLERLETAYRWRSITYIGGSFPLDLRDLQKNDQHELPRHEWLSFSRERLRGVRYGDYTVQHPFQTDPPPKSLPSGSIRYASDTYWVVMRGEKLDNPTGPGYQQYIAQAQLLCERPEFRGSQFSAGDAYIAAMSRQTLHTGGPESWLQAGINHHLTFVARQIGSALAA